MSIDYQALAGALIEQVRHKSLAGSTPTAVPAHGPGGLWSTPGLVQPVINAMGLPAAGLASRLPAQVSMETHPFIGVVTGIDEEEGEEQDGVCDDPPGAGLMRGCTVTFPFGAITRKSRTFDLTSFGKVKNRGEFRDNNLIGGMSNQTHPMVPTMPNGANSPANAIRSDISKGLWELGVAFTRKFGRLTYSGNPINNSPKKGYKEFKGLELLVNDGYVDAENGSTTCEAVDSVLVDFGASINADAEKTVSAVTSTYRELKMRAESMGFGSTVKWVIAMRNELFYELTAVWPCAYATSGCAVSNDKGQRVTVSADAQIAMRDNMRNEFYLLIDGERVEVVPDAAITMLGAGGEFESDIYIVPETVLGGYQVLYWEFVNYDDPMGAMAAAAVLAPDGHFRVTDGGRFLWAYKPPTVFCVEVLARAEPRLVLLTPHLAARIQGVKHTAARDYHSPWPDEEGYKAGGVNTR